MMWKIIGLCCLVSVAQAVDFKDPVVDVSTICKYVSILNCNLFANHPVCGTNNITYDSHCLFSKAHCQDTNLHMSHNGTCFTGNQGSHGGQTTYEFFCRNLVHTNCGSDFEIVCGSDNITYDNLIGEHDIALRQSIRSGYGGTQSAVVDPLSYVKFQLLLYDWYNKKGRSVYYSVCGLLHMKDPFVLIGESSPRTGGRGFPFSLSEWSFNQCPTFYNPACLRRLAALTETCTSKNTTRVFNNSSNNNSQYTLVFVIGNKTLIFLNPVL